MFEINLRINPIQHIAVEAVLEEMGALSISLRDAADDPVFALELNETPLWKNITLTALFEKKFPIGHLQHTLEKILTCPVEISTQTIHEQDWQNSFKQNFAPIQFAERLWVCPSWHTPPDPFAINIQLDPGLAFGTGTHPTTALCLEWLANHPPIDKTVLDFGCGSGILAIAAFYLGASAVVATDHDPQAIQATQINAQHNHIPKKKFKTCMTSHLNNMKYEVLMANVLLQPLLELKACFFDMLIPNGKIILSGILEQQVDELVQAYQTSFGITQIYSKNKWLLVVATRN